MPHDTIPNFGRSIDQGSDVIRTNVSLTRDGRIVCYSDEVFSIDTIRKSGIGSFGIRELRDICRRAMTVGSGAGEKGELFPELEESLRAFPEQRFNLFFLEKSAGLMEEAAGVIERAGAEGRVLASARSGFNIAKIISALPDAAIAMSTAGMIGVYALFRSGLLYFKKQFAADALIIPVRMGTSYIANDALIHEVRGKGIRVYVMNVDTPAEARAFRAAGADGFITNDIESIRSAMA